MSDAAELEREAEAARARLSETADELRARMSPGQIMDEVLNQFRDGDGSQMFANLRSQARDNPMALALVGSGLAWLMMGSGPSAAGTRTGSSPTYRAPAASGLRDPEGYRSGGGAGYGEGFAEDSGALSSAQTTLGEGWQHAKDKGAGIADSLRSAGSDAAGSVRGGTERVGHMADDVMAAGADALGGVRHGAADLGNQARRTFLDVLEREPLVIGALGVAVGAAIGALLPASEIERQHLGATGEALKEKASHLVDRGVAVAKEAAGEVYDAARDEADRQGLVPGDRPIAEKIDAVVRAAGDTATTIAERHGAAPVDATSDTGSAPGADDTKDLPRQS